MLVAFFHVLEYLSHCQGEAVTFQEGTPATSAHVLYGGNALQAFLVCVETHAQFFFGFPFGNVVHLGPGNALQPL
jgi:hypothetical protein